LFDYLREAETTTLFVAVAGLISILVGQTNLIKNIFGTIPIAHKIAVIGLPTAGKTSLITAMFELIQKGQSKPSVRIHGTKTIALINGYIARLASGQALAPTKENDIFIFRFSYLKRRAFQTLLYDIEIADFPGEYTKHLEETAPTTSSDDILDADFANETLLNREFLSWVASSSKYLFVIDLEHLPT
jgi:predicted YcjX-like family ATPase